jgi:hypothetical protein
MLYRRTYLCVLATAALALACGDNHPTNPSLASVGTEASISSNSKRPGASLTGTIEQTIAGNVINAVVRVTRLTQGADGGLLASGVITGTANGQSFTQNFTDVPATLTDAAAGAVAAAAGPSIQQVGSCAILGLDLGPLHLDVLGLVVDLNQVVLDITAQAGAGNLLGNLLCAVVHLFDGPGLFAAIANLLDQINAILGAF